MRRHRRLGALHFLFAASLMGPAGSQAAAVIGETRQMAIPVTSGDETKTAFRQPATIPFPLDNLYTPEKTRLGRILFFDPRLSRTGLQSCSSCHNPALAYGDGLTKGADGGVNPLPRRSPTIINAVLSDALMWDGRFDTLEAQALGAIQSTTVMNMPIAMVVERLGAVDAYRKMFDVAFPGRPLDGEGISRAIATYERTIASARSPFDGWIEGDERAISDAAKHGFEIFTGKARCVACHSGWNFSDNGFHDIGLVSNDLGRGKFFPENVKMQHAFKTPSLREIDRRAPYMHDASLPTLEAVITHYDGGGLARPGQSELVKPMGLTDGEKSDLAAFLRTLSSLTRPASAPSLPR
jgi:cytochrome c peroxidase